MNPICKGDYDARLSLILQIDLKGIGQPHNGRIRKCALIRSTPSQ
jgi:hypothetical protein